MNTRSSRPRKPLLVLLAVVVAASVAAAQAQEQMQVQVRQAPVRQKAEALAPVVGTLKYADRVTVQEKLSNGWLRITGLDQAISGYLRASALADKVAPLKAGDGAASVSAEDVSLAGKGLKDSVDQYITKHNLQAAAAKLDDIERRSYTELSPEQVAEFRAAGGLSSAEGR